MIENILISYLDPNPYQTRVVEDPEHIQSLAKSIQERGLLQIPTGRSKGERFQLAFGHSRLAAFKSLFEAGNTEYGVMSVNIQVLTDQQMFELAVTENHERKDLNPLEEARAMAVYRDTFGKTSEEIGQLFHLSDSAVRNKMRLVNLPDDARKALGEGRMSEGAARELLALYDLPESLLQKGAATSYWCDPAMILEKAADGAKASEIKELVDRLVVNSSSDMSDAPWKHVDLFEAVDGVEGPCKGCQYLVEYSKKPRCQKPDCFQAKWRAFKTRYLAGASEASGIQMLESDKSIYEHSTIYGDEKLAEIRKTHCENLRIYYDHGGNNKDIAGFPYSKVLCQKRSGFCTCQKALEAKVELAKAAQNKPLGGEDLKQLGRDLRRQAKDNKQKCLDLEQQAIDILVEGIRDMNPRTLYRILQKMTYSSTQSISRDDLEAIIRAIAAQMVIGMTWQDDPERLRKSYDEFLEGAGLHPLYGELYLAITAEQAQEVPSL